MSASENQIIVYQPNETVRLDVRLENETVWLTQARLGVLFGVDRTVVNRHIHNIYKTGELEESATCAKIAQVQNEGGRSITRIVPFYNLDMIIEGGGMNEVTKIGAEVETCDIRPIICELRGQAVMLDRDLADLYHVMTGRLNEAVKRNLARFPSDFMFQLPDMEMKELIANCDRFKMMKHSPSRMYAFTEQGVAMLSAVLKSDIAIRESIRIMKAFVLMRRLLSTSMPTLASLASRVEANERRQIEDQAKNEQRFEEIHAKMSEGDIPQSQIFYQNKFWDAKSLLIKFIRRAKKELIVIDTYPGVATLDMLAKRGRGVKIALADWRSQNVTAKTDVKEAA